MKNNEAINLVLAEGEGYKIEFKEAYSLRIERDFVAFANTSGGSIWLGINDNSEVIGIKTTNRLKSQIYDIARNCDPSIPIRFGIQTDNVLEISIPEGIDKPYQCKDGFFLRIGPSTQKLKRDEIINLISQSGYIGFDESMNNSFNYPEDFSVSNYDKYLSAANISVNTKIEDILLSLNIAKEENNAIKISNAGLLFFSQNPQNFLRESFITYVQYDGADRFQIIDKKDFTGTLLDQIEDACSFFRKNVKKTFQIENNAQRKEIWEYPFIAFREAIINAVAHRDYYYDSSHIYIHHYRNRIEIENPGGLFRGLSIEDLGRKSVRRNKLIADLLYRAGYIEGVGSGISRIRTTLKENGNPKFEASSTNFFSIRFYPVQFEQGQTLPYRQGQIITALRQRGPLTKNDISQLLNVSGDTALREINQLLQDKFIQRTGIGKAIRYALNKDLNILI